MPTYNYKSRELIAKIVYYGPGRCGKTTNLQQIHQRMRPETRSELLSVATETDRTIYFDLLPLNLGTISGMKFMVRLFTVPGQVYYAETRKLVLRGADGIVFVADSQDHMMDENRQSLRDLRDNLAANGLDYGSIPLVFQWNKRDLPQLISEAELEATLNDRHVKTVSAVASQGDGVLETLRHVTLSVFNHIKAGGKSTRSTRPGDSAAAGSSAGPATSPPMGAPPFARPATSPGIGEFPSPTPDSRVPSSPPPPPGSWSSSLPRPGAYGMQGSGAGTNRRATPPFGAPPTPNASSIIPGIPASPSGFHPSAPRGMTPPSMPAVLPLSPPASSAGAPPISRMPPPMRPPSPPAPPRDEGAGRSGPPPIDALDPHGPQPVKISVEMVLEEFHSLAIAQSQMAERMATLENQISRLGRENQEIREMLTRR